MDKIRNEYIGGTAQVGRFGEKTRERGHVFEHRLIVIFLHQTNQQFSQYLWHLDVRRILCCVNPTF